MKHIGRLLAASLLGIATVAPAAAATTQESTTTVPSTAPSSVASTTPGSPATTVALPDPANSYDLGHGVYLPHVDGEVSTYKGTLTLKLNATTIEFTTKTVKLLDQPVLDAQAEMLAFSYGTFVFAADSLTRYAEGPPHLQITESYAEAISAPGEPQVHKFVKVFMRDDGLELLTVRTGDYPPLLDVPWSAMIASLLAAPAVGPRQQFPTPVYLAAGRSGPYTSIPWSATRLMPTVEGWTTSVNGNSIRTESPTAMVAATRLTDLADMASATKAAGDFARAAVGGSGLSNERIDYPGSSFYSERRSYRWDGGQLHGAAASAEVWLLFNPHTKSAVVAVAAMQGTALAAEQFLLVDNVVLNLRLDEF